MSTSHHVASDEDPTENSDNKNMNLLVENFSKFMKKKGRDNWNSKKKSTKKIDSTLTTYTCIKCGTQGHIKTYYPTYLKKQQGGDTKQKKSFKNRRTYIACDDNDASSLSDSSDEEEADLCLMDDIYEDETKSNVSDSFSESNTNYDNLLDAFKELHEEAQRLIFANKTLKGQVRWHIDVEAKLHGECDSKVFWW